MDGYIAVCCLASCRRKINLQGEWAKTVDEHNVTRYFHLKPCWDLFDKNNTDFKEAEVQLIGDNHGKKDG